MVMSDEISYWVIVIDKDPQPWEPYDEPYAIIKGTESDLSLLRLKIQLDHPKWMVHCNQVKNFVDGDNEDIYGVDFGICLKCGLEINNSNQHKKYCN
jgi:hypothetical protein